MTHQAMPLPKVTRRMVKVSAKLDIDHIKSHSEYIGIGFTVKIIEVISEIGDARQ